MVYLDDVIVYSKDEKQHEQDVKALLERLEQYNLKISLKKCQFFKKDVRFLGFFVSGDGIRSDPSKVDAISTWPVPGNVKSLQRFLGFCAFYHRFITDLSSTAAPLYRLLKKDDKFEWNSGRQKAFDALKKRILVLPTLAYPDADPALPYDLHCDASDVGLGASLVQEGRPVAFASRTLTTAEKNYTTTEKECLAIVWALNYFHPYVYGAALTIYTDHAALKSILSTKMPRGRIARWILTLKSYQFTIIHKNGSLNADADALSRLATANNQDVPPLISRHSSEKTNMFNCSLRKGRERQMAWNHIKEF